TSVSSDLIVRRSVPGMSEPIMSVPRSCAPRRSDWPNQAPPTMVRRSYQTPVKQRIVAEKGSNDAGSAGLIGRAFHRTADTTAGQCGGPRIVGLEAGIPQRPRRGTDRIVPVRCGFAGSARRATRARPPLYGAMMLLLKRLIMLATTVVAILGAAEPALAGLGQPSPWQLGLQQSASPVMDNIIWFHDFLLYIITGIAGFVLALLIVVMLRFNARANPIPSRTTHNTLIETAWTLIPIMILMFIAVPSFKLLFLQLNVPAA